MVISAAEVPSTLATYKELIFKTLPEEAALLRMDVADVVVRSTVTDLPVIVVGESKFGAAISISTQRSSPQLQQDIQSD